MRFGGAWLVIVAFASGCSSRYYVRPEHVAAGRRAVVPAVNAAGEDTYLQLSAVGEARGLMPDGLQEVVASDPRPGAKIAGWIVLPTGLVNLAYGLSIQDEPYTEDAAQILIIAGGIQAGIGLVLLLVGYGSMGPEAEAPSEGMPPTVRVPPPAPAPVPVPATAAPATAAPAIAAPATAAPATAAPATAGPATAGPETAGPDTAAPPIVSP